MLLLTLRLQQFEIGVEDVLHCLHYVFVKQWKLGHFHVFKFRVDFLLQKSDRVFDLGQFQEEELAASLFV